MIPTFIGYICAGLAFAIIVFIFVYLWIKRNQLAKVPVFIIILAIIGFILGIAAAGVIIGNNIWQFAKSGTSSISSTSN